MKSINYLFISFFILMTLCSGIFLNPQKTRTLTLQATIKEAGSVSLQQSAEIIKSRLNQYGVKSFDVKIYPEMGQVKIQVPENTGISEIEGLITAKGELAFYETYTKDEIAGMMGSDNQLLRLMNPLKDGKPYDPRVGCIGNDSRKKAEEYLITAPKLNNCKFAWQSESRKTESCLFALKTDKNGNPLISRSDIESVKITSSSEGTKIMIRLKAQAAGIFADATKANLNKAIAIVIDDMVYSWPVVRSVIEKGEIEVTGNFTANEVNYFPVIFNTQRLPLNFKLIQ